MATRATYRFYTGDTAYHHWDGYPQGAAHLLSNALVDGGDLTIESFLKANDKAERTESHQIHGDTEYRYDIMRNQEGKWSIKVSERIDFSDKWRIAYYGSARDFFKNYGRL
jgi:hypothetical protein